MRNFHLLAFSTFLADRLSKYLVLQADFRIIEILPFFRIIKVWNKGIAFGFFGSFSVANFVFTLLTILALGMIFFWARKAQGLTRLGLALVFGGGLGNLLDRILFSAVLDFIDLHLGDLHWPAFNVADLAITIGLVLIILKQSKTK